MAQETLTACGYEARVATLTRKVGRAHAIALFTMKDGTRGFIDCGDSNTYKPGTPWEKIIQDVRGGPWKGIDD